MTARHPTRAALSFGAALAIAACTPPIRPGATPTLPTPAADSSPEPAESAPWSFALAEGTHRFELRSEAVVEDLTAMVADTIALEVYFSYVSEMAAPRRSIRGTVDSLTVSNGPEPLATSPSATGAAAPQLPIPFELVLDSTGRVVEVISADTSSCGSPTGAMLALVRDAFPGVPQALTPGMQWTDTTTSISCRGDIPIMQTSVRTNAVTGAQVNGDTLNVRILRRADFEISGTGTRRVQTTTVTGRGHGQSEMVIDPLSGRYLGSRGESVLELTFDAASRRAVFRQRNRFEVRPL